MQGLDGERRHALVRRSAAHARQGQGVQPRRRRTGSAVPPMPGSVVLDGIVEQLLYVAAETVNAGVLARRRFFLSQESNGSVRA